MLRLGKTRQVASFKESCLGASLWAALSMVYSQQESEQSGGGRVWLDPTHRPFRRRIKWKTGEYLETVGKLLLTPRLAVKGLTARWKPP